MTQPELFPSPPRRARDRMRPAVVRWLRELDIDPTTDGRARLVLALATSFDEARDHYVWNQLAPLAKELREAIRELGAADDPVAELLAELTAAE